MNPLSRPPRLAMMTLPGLDHFTGDLLARLPAVSGWDVTKFSVTGPAVLNAALAWTDDPQRDALWFEFCWPPFPAIIAATDFAGRRIIVRVHRIEAVETSFVADTCWEKVDDVIVVSPDMRQRVMAVAPEINIVSRLHLICNGVDIHRFAPSAAPDPFRIGWCGMMTTRKNPTLALQILAQLHKDDARYGLRLCGMSSDVLAQDSFVHLAERLELSDRVVSDGKVALAGMPAWHAANSVLLHTSLHEGLSCAVLEAAACGCDLAVLDHPGADDCWPEAILFRTVDEAVTLIRQRQPMRWRAYVSERFALQRQIEAVHGMLRSPTTAPSRK